MSNLLIQGGRVVDPAGNVDGLHDVLVHDGLIAAVVPAGVLPDMIPLDFERVDFEFLDARGLVVAPGLIDLHVHLREPGQTYKETIASGTRAAAAGGFTTVVAMPNTLPVNDSAETMRWMLAPERRPTVRLFAMAAATLGSQGRELTDFEALARAGALGFTDDGKPILDEAVMCAALLRAAQLGLPVSQHAEDPRLSNGAIMNAGPMAFQMGLRGYPNVAEAAIVERDIAFVRELGRGAGVRPHLHVQHCSTAEALDAIRRAKSEGLHVTCEAAPHHFALTEAAVGDFDTNARMNPPLRSEADRLALIAALIDGTVDCIATDHAPHALYEKEQEFERAPNGITGLETALGLALRILHGEHGMPLGRVLALMSQGPAQVAGLAQAGSLAPGMWADIVLFDVGEPWRFAAAESLSKSKNTPFNGAFMQGRVKHTIVAGQRVFSR